VQQSHERYRAERDEEIPVDGYRCYDEATRFRAHGVLLDTFDLTRFDKNRVVLLR